VMTQRWHLVNGRELYDIKTDPGQNNNVASMHPDVVKPLRESYENYWARVAKNDDQLAAFAIGSDHQLEAVLGHYNAYSSSNLDFLSVVGQMAHNHAATMRGASTPIFWQIDVAGKGRYRFEVRRWPREADMAMRGSYVFNKKVDGWLHDKPITGTANPSLLKGKALPIHSIRLRVGDQEHTLDVNDTQKSCLFTFDLAEGPAKVEATIIDAAGKAFGSAHYVYVRPTDVETE